MCGGKAAWGGVESAVFSQFPSWKQMFQVLAGQEQNVKNIKTQILQSIPSVTLWFSEASGKRRGNRPFPAPHSAAVAAVRPLASSCLLLRLPFLWGPAAPRRNPGSGPAAAGLSDFPASGLVRFQRACAETGLHRGLSLRAGCVSQELSGGLTFGIPLRRTHR